MDVTGPGCYLIKKGKKIVYAGHSKTDVKKTLYRHFQTWTDRRNHEQRNQEAYERVTYQGYDLNEFKIKVFYTTTPREAELLEQIFIQKIKPEDNTQKLMLFSPQEQYQAFEKLDQAVLMDDNPPF